MGKIVKNLLGLDSNIFIYQDKDMFNYSVDTIMLGNFITINRKIRKLLEIGTNNGALSIFVSERSPDIKIDAIEIQKKALNLAKKNIELNSKENQIKLINGDFNLFYKKHCKEQMRKYDSIFCNPPFYKVNSHIKRKGSEEIHIATHEIKINLEQIIKGSSKIIRQKGYITLVEPTERLVDIFVLLRKYNFEPKRVQFIHPRINSKSILVLVEARFNSGWGTKFLENLYLHPEDKKDKSYKENIIKLYKPIKVKGD